MAHINVVEPSGHTVALDVPDGWSIMQAATAGGVDGILGECGGSCACATCHCYVDEQLMAVLPAAQDNELGMLEHVVAERRPNSRLACQIKGSAALAGATITLPECQE